jgi:hypothetical protein
VRKPYVAKKLVVSFLVEDQLAVAAEAGVNLAVTIQVWGSVPGSVLVVEIENCALSDIDKETDILATPVIRDIC